MLPSCERMKRVVPVIMLILATLASGCVRQAFVDSDDSEDDPTDRIPVAFDQEFELGLGDTALLADTDIEITFSVVTGDSRCPSDVVCITAGQATILLLIRYPVLNSNNIAASIPGLIPTPYRDNEKLPIDGARIKLLRLSPYPDTTKPHGLGEYRALFVVES